MQLRVAALEVNARRRGRQTPASRRAHAPRQGGAAADGLSVEAPLRHPVNAHPDRNRWRSPPGGGLYEVEDGPMIFRPASRTSR